MEPGDINDMEERLQTLQGGFAALYTVCCALAETHPNKPLAKQALEQGLERVTTHYLNESFPDSVHEAIDHYSKDFLAILQR